MIDILPFAPQHAAGVVALVLPIQQTEFGIPIDLEAQPDLQDIPGFFQWGKGNFWVALDGADIVGTVALLDIGEQQAALRKMFVKASHRGKELGIAKRLLDTLFAWSRQASLRDVFLGTTDKYLAAHRFYEKHGFSEITRTELPANFPIMAVDSKFYRHEVDC